MSSAGSDVLLSSRHGRPLTRYFPEVVESVLAAPTDRFVLDGELVAGDFSALMLRLHSSPTRVARLREETPAAFMAFDLLAVRDADLRAQPLVDRRSRLEELLIERPAAGPALTDAVALSPSTPSHDVAEDWLGRASAGVDGVVAKVAASLYETGRRSTHWLKVKRQRTADCVVAVFASP